MTATAQIIPLPRSAVVRDYDAPFIDIAAELAVAREVADDPDFWRAGRANALQTLMDWGDEKEDCIRRARLSASLMRDRPVTRPEPWRAVYRRAGWAILAVGLLAAGNVLLAQPFAKARHDAAIHAVQGVGR